MYEMQADFRMDVYTVTSSQCYTRVLFSINISNYLYYVHSKNCGAKHKKLGIHFTMKGICKYYTKVKDIV